MYGVFCDCAWRAQHPWATPESVISPNEMDTGRDHEEQDRGYTYECGTVEERQVHTDDTCLPCVVRALSDRFDTSFGTCKRDGDMCGNNYRAPGRRWCGEQGIVESEPIARHETCASLDLS